MKRLDFRYLASTSARVSLLPRKRTFRRFMEPDEHCDISTPTTYQEGPKRSVSLDEP